MKIKYYASLLVLCLFSTSLLAVDSYDFLFNKIDPQLISYKIVDNRDENWINVNHNSFVDKSPFSFSVNKNDTFSDEIALAWNFTSFLSVNVNVFEEKYNNDFLPTSSTNNFAKYNKTIPVQIPGFDSNRRLSGYKLGISSELGLGNKYKVGINLDYGQLDGADLVGFNSNEINTTSFELGIRKNKFGASINTDLFLEDNADLTGNSRFGLELDWYFSDDTIFSFGSKQRLNETTSQASYLESLTGSVQYIKFQHNL